MTLRLLATLIAIRQQSEPRLRSHIHRDEDGSVTTEHVLWAVAVIAIVGVVVAAVKTYVETQAGNIK